MKIDSWTKQKITQAVNLFKGGMVKTKLQFDGDEERGVQN